MIIGLGKFKMEIDIAAETKKMKKEIRKVGDKSGVGCNEKQMDADASSRKQPVRSKLADAYDQRVMREAKLLLSGQADKVPQLE